MSTIDLTLPFISRTGKQLGDLLVTLFTAAKADVVKLEDNNHAIKGADLTDAPATITVAQGKWRVLPAATLSATRAFTLSTTGAVAGDQITITRLDTTANTITVVNGGVGAGTLATLPVSTTGFVKAQFDGTNWALREIGKQLDGLPLGRSRARQVDLGAQCVGDHRRGQLDAHRRQHRSRVWDRLLWLRDRSRQGGDHRWHQPHDDHRGALPR